MTLNCAILYNQAKPLHNGHPAITDKCCGSKLSALENISFRVAKTPHQFIGTLSEVVGEPIAATLQVLALLSTGGTAGSHALTPDNEGVLRSQGRETTLDFNCRATEWPFWVGHILPFSIINIFNWIVFGCPPSHLQSVCRLSGSSHLFLPRPPLPSVPTGVGICLWSEGHTWLRHTLLRRGVSQEQSST